MLNQSSDHGWEGDWGTYVQDALAVNQGGLELNATDIKRFSKTFKRLSQLCPSLSGPAAPSINSKKEAEELSLQVQQKCLEDFISVLRDV